MNNGPEPENTPPWLAKNERITELKWIRLTSSLSLRTMSIFRILLVFSLTLLIGQGAAANGDVYLWDVFEVEMTASRDYENPYSAIPDRPGVDLVKVVFTGTDGEAQGQTITVVGFWDGGRTWRARFAPPAAGTWTYRSESSDPGLNGKTGSFRAVARDPESLAENPTRHGFVRVKQTGPAAGHYFEYADGTPFLWVGDTWWNWTNRRIHFSTFKNLVDDRSRKGFTIGQLFVAANGWGQQSSILLEDYTVLDVAHMQRVDSMIQYANSRGLTVWVHGWWSRENLNETAGEEKMRRWWRYLVHRLGAYNVVWTLGGEYNMYNYGGLGLDFWKDLGALIDEEDPYERIIGTHNTPPAWQGGADAPQWSTGSVLHNEPWLDYNQSQVGHGKWRNELIPDVVAEDYARTPAKPIVVTEPWYEFVEGNPTGQDIRFAAWSAMTSGAAGHTYGGGHVWLAHTPEAPGGPGSWPLETGFERNTLDYEGAVSMGHFASFFKGVEWWTMTPRPDLVHEYADPYALARPGEEYVVYLRWGGGAKVDLRPSTESDRFEWRWYDPATGEYSNLRTVSGGGVHFFPPDGDYPGVLNYRDMVLHIRKVQN